MRHIRLPGQNMKNLSSFKNQISGILKDLNKFDTEKNEALSYIRRYIEPSTSSGSSSTSKKRARTYNKITKSPRKTKPKINNKLRKYVNSKNIASLKFTFKCKTCKVSERSKPKMLKHLETHVEWPLSCIKCRKTFNGSVSYNWHVKYYCKKITMRNLSLKCNQCPQEFVSKRTLKSHLQGHNRNNCTYCDKVLTRRVHLIRHLLQEHSIKLERDTHSCSQCEKRYIKKTSLYYHLRQHFPDKFICMECGQIIDTNEKFVEHKSQHDIQKHFTCSKCNEKFSRRQQYLLHIKRHNRYKCITCNETFASRAKVVPHKQQGHLVEGLNPRFNCAHCPLTFHRESKFLLHLRKHTDDFRSINCKYCKKSFNSPYAYYKHCITINHEKYSPETINITCHKCNKRFMKRHHLRQHIYNVHNERKQMLKCAYCEYKSVHRANLDRHIALHFRQINQFTCEHCGKSFDSLSNLKSHITYNHVQEKRFNCDKCDKSFKRSSELIRHKNTHSDERPFSCSKCDKAYKRLNHLKRHEKSAHEIANERQRIQQIDLNQAGCSTNQRNDILLNFLEVSDASNSGNIIEQITCPFVPDKGWNIDNEELYKVYNDVALNYGNQNLTQGNE